MSGGALVSHFQVSISVDGDDYGIWDTKDGGDVDSEEVRYKPGAMEEESLGGSKSISAITVTRNFRRGRDDALLPELRAKVGSGRAVVKILALDADGNPWTTSDIYKGTLKRVGHPTVDSNASDVAMVELEITPDGSVAS